MSNNKEKISSLYKDLDDVMSKREELQAELNAMTTMAVKLQGAIEVLEEMNNESGSVTLQQFAKGFYIAQFTLENGHAFTKKFILN